MVADLTAAIAVGVCDLDRGTAAEISAGPLRDVVAQSSERPQLRPGRP